MTLNIEKQFQDNYYIETPILSILFVLCFFEDKITLKAKDFNGDFNQMKYVYNNYLEKYGIKIDAKTIIYNPIDKLDKRKEDYLEITFYIEDDVKESLKDYLKEYLDNYQKDEIIKQNGETLISYDSLKKNFFDSIDTTLSRVNYNLTTIKYLPIIFCENVCLNTIKIKNIFLTMNSDEGYINELIHEDSETDLDYLYDFLSASVLLDISNFMLENDKESQSHKKYISYKDFTDKEKNVIHNLKKLLNNGKQSIQRNYLRTIFKVKNDRLNDYVYQLNKKCEILYNKKLLKNMDRATKEYEINPIKALFD